MQLNNLDVIILIVIFISALIALNRGLIKEVLSIIGWFLGIASVVYVLPIINPLAQKFIASETMAGVASSVFILVVFFIFWILLTSNLISKIRSSKLSSMDRVLGLFFGVIRAFLLVILFYIMVSWIMPISEQPEIFKQSKYFQLAGTFAEPIEKLIPQDTLKSINQKTSKVMEDGKKLSNEEDKEKVSEEKPIPSEIDNLFEKLSQPQIEKKSSEEGKSENKSYNQSEKQNLERLIEMTIGEE